MPAWLAHPDLLYLFDLTFLWVLLTDGLGLLIFALWLIIKTHPRADRSGPPKNLG